MPIYMKIEGIDGSAKADGHDKWIVLESCQFGVNRHIAAPKGVGTNREAAAPSVSEIIVTKTMDDASANLFKASLFGVAKKVDIHFTKTSSDGGKGDAYLTLELENTLVSSLSVSGHGGDHGGSLPMESLSLNYTKINYSAINTDDKNKAAKPQRASYDLVTMKGA